MVLAGGATGAGGCASASTQGQKRVQGFTKTREVLDESAAQVDATLRAMNDVRRAPAEQKGEAFARYKKAVEKLEKQAADAKWQAQVLKEQSDEHIRKWQEEMKSISDPTMKASLQSRRDAVKTNFTLIQMYADDVRKAYEPFLSGNQQLVKALSIDLSPATVSGLSESMDRVTADGVTLLQKISMMQHALNNIANGLSPIGL
jgi:hypothetical protein